MSKILFIAGFPPPASGQLIMQKKMFDLLKTEDRKLINLDFSNSSRDFSKISVSKIIKLLRIVFQIIGEGLWNQWNISKVYYSLSGPKRNALIKDIIIGFPLNLLFKRKLILQVHAGGYNQDFVENKFLFHVLQKLYKNIEHLLCLTKYQERELKFLNAKTTSIIYNFCEEVSLSNEHLANGIKSINNSLRLLSVGHLNNNKGIVECIDLANLLKTNGIDFCWKFIGSFQDKNFEIKILDMIEAYNLQTYIMIEDEVANDKILSEYGQSDFLIFLSNGPEGQPVVLIEALMIAHAVIITKDICGIGEYVRNGYNGFVVNEYTEILPILANQKRNDFSRIRSNGKNTYHEQFSVKIFSQKVSKIFKKSFTDSLPL